jgi:hypothetical protein
VLPKPYTLNIHTYRMIFLCDDISKRCGQHSCVTHALRMLYSVCQDDITGCCVSSSGCCSSRVRQTAARSRRSLSLSHTHTHSLTFSHSLSLSLSPTPTLTHSLSHSITLCLYLSLSLSIYIYMYITSKASKLSTFLPLPRVAAPISEAALMVSDSVRYCSSSLRDDSFSSSRLSIW